MSQDRVRDRGRGRVPGVLIDHDLDPVGRQHLDRGRERGLGERVRVDPQEERTIDAPRRAVFADRLRGGQDVGLVERALGGRASMAGGAE